MPQQIEYRGKRIVQVWNGWRLEEPNGARHPETYGNLDDAKRSVDFDIKNRVS